MMPGCRLALIVSLACLAACARKRPVERVYDFDENRWQKSVFLDNPGNPWLGKVTIVKESNIAAFSFAGLQSQAMAGYWQITKDKLKFVSAVNQGSGSVGLDSIINQWSVTHSDYQLQKVGGRVTNVEVENNEIPWSEKRYIKVNWDEADISERVTFLGGINDSACWIKKDVSVVEGSQAVSAEHIGFTVSVDYELNLSRPRCVSIRRGVLGALTHTVQYKYSFRPIVQSDYKPYVYTGENDPLFRKYGYFSTVVQLVGEFNQIENKFLMNRWDPTKTHIFYFDKEFPEEFKSIFTDPNFGIFAVTNKLFEDNGLSTRFEVRENDGTKEFGDIRYSFIKAIDDVGLNAPLGYGPSDVNPFTGEILAANLLLWTGELEYIVKIISDQVSRYQDAKDKSSIFREMKQFLGEDIDSWTASKGPLVDGSAVQEYFNLLLPDYTFGGAGSVFSRGAEAEYFNGLEASVTSTYMTEQARESFIPFAEQAQNIRAEALEQVGEVYHSANSTVYRLDEAVGGVADLLIEGISGDEIIRKILYKVAIHEFGHNLNLRHNFYGSVDKKNFKPDVLDSKGVARPQITSSVMEYLPLKDRIFYNQGWESYDEAALLYAYSSGKKDISTEQATNFLYCTDEHVWFNAMCNRWDKGASPSEIVMAMISSYDDRYWINNFRAGRALWNAGGYPFSIFFNIFELKKFVKLYEHTFKADDVALKLGSIAELALSDINAISSAVSRDMKQAILILSAFMGSVIKQNITDRPYTDQYDNWTGSLERLGIFYDKIFAAQFLLGDEGFLYDPNKGITPSTVLSLQGDADIGTTLTKIVEESVLNPGPMYYGYDQFVRAIYGQNAAYWRDNGGFSGPITQMRVACYQPESLERLFGIADVNSFSQSGEPPSKLVSGVVNLNLLSSVTDPYFSTGSTAVAVLLVNGKYYVASREQNKVSFDIINRGLASDSIQLYNLYTLLTEGRIPDCI